MKKFSQMIFNWKNIYITHANKLAVLFVFFLFVRLFFAYKDILPSWSLLGLDALVSVLALFFAWGQIDFFKEYDPIILRCAKFVVALPLGICLIGVIAWNDFTGVTEYLGLYSAYLGVAICFLQLANSKKS